MSVSAQLRERLLIASQYRCGYCLTSQVLSGTPLEIDHLVPVAEGGRTIEENLWMACRPCNLRKTDHQAALDAITGETVRLFNPRFDRWSEHFAWSGDGLFIEGSSAIGRATLRALDLNRPTLVTARKIWVAFKVHPPS